MKKTAVGLSLFFLSGSVFAVENGTPVDWQHDFDDVVNNHCTGLVVGGNHVLTAKHCPDVTDMAFANGDKVTASRRADHPDYVRRGSGSPYDVSVWTLPHAVKTSNIHYFSDLKTQSVSVGDSIKAYGFGGDYPLAYADIVIDRLFPHITEYQGRAVAGALIGGDSGGVWMKNGLIVGINQTSDGYVTGNVGGTDLHYANDFLLETIDGWHYPTVLEGTGTKTVKIQSLHQNPVSDTAYVDGHVTITGGSCQTKSTIDAFETCTYQLEINGSGKLYLTDHEVIDINPQDAPPVTTAPGSGGSSGGSLGFLSLFGLALLGRFRKS
ncbi:trypsin-like serine protease [Vibrio splendidus]|uniref:trypsin-like serine protease n=1 Tax=Vibrio splendidus TaxID=29497 RepID=UPI003D0AAB39